MSEITTRKKIDISTFHAHAGITRSTLEGVAESASNKTIRTNDISQEALEAAIESYIYSVLPPRPDPNEAKKVALRNKLGLTAAEWDLLRRG